MMSTKLERLDWHIAPAEDIDAGPIASIVSDGFLETYPQDGNPEYNARIEEYAKKMLKPERILSKAAFILSSASDPGRTYFVAREGSSHEIQGAGYATRTEESQELVMLYVHRLAQGRGAGGAMLRHLLHPDDGFFDLRWPIKVGVGRNNERAMRVYGRFGFEIDPKSERDFKGIEGMREMTMIRKGDES